VEVVENQVVIITGGSRGIGYGIAGCFAEKGATLVIADLDEDGGRCAAQELNSRGAVNSIAIRCDVSRRDQVEQMAEAVMTKYGRINVLVNNAGICPFVDVMEMQPDVFLKTLEVNLIGAYYCTHAVARPMIERKQGGRIVFITSLAENVTGPSQVDYGASKGGLRMLMVGFATALGKYGITSNAVAPGMILTDLTRWHWEQPGPAEEIRKRVPVGRIGTPTDVGHAVVFLASDQASYINGVSLRVDGGHQAVCV
jgi:NAD(P)-dependent dehydrogenase (short-subunit alcohol dehydrogenase family)